MLFLVLLALTRLIHNGQFHQIPVTQLLPEAWAVQAQIGKIGTEQTMLL